MKPRIIIWAGVVTSLADGQKHPISAPQLAQLYSVPRGRYTTPGPGWHPQPGDINLWPRSGDDYWPVDCGVVEA